MKRIFISIFLSLFLTQNVFAITAEQYYAMAYGYIAKNNTKEAKRTFEKAIITYPNKAFLYSGMGDAFLDEQNYTKAMDFYIQAQKRDKTNILYKINFYDCIVKNIQNNIEITKRNLIKSTKYGSNKIVYKNINYLMQEKYSDLEFIPIIYPDDINDSIPLEANYKKLNNLGVIALIEKKYTDSEKYFTKALSLNDKAEFVLNNLAVTYCYLQNFKKADEYFKSATNINATNQDIINNSSIATLLMSINSYSQPNISVMNNLLKTNNTNLYVKKVLAWMLFYKGKYKDAENVLNTALIDTNYKIFYEKALVSYKNGNHKKSLEEINKAVRLYPNIGAFYILKGRILTDEKQYVAAKNAFLEVKRNNMPIDGYFYQADLAYRNSTKEEAQSFMQKFWSQNGGYLKIEDIQNIFE